MISLSEEITIPSALDEVWPLLRDPRSSPHAFPALHSLQRAKTAFIGARSGPSSGRPSRPSAAKRSSPMTTRRCTIEGGGIDGRGASRALASGVVTASGGETTILRLEGSFNVAGPLETFANAGGIRLARELLAEFAGNVARVIAERSTQIAKPEPDRPSPQPSPRDAGSPLGARVRAPVGWHIFDAPGDPRQREGEGHPSPQALGVGAGDLYGGRLLWRTFLGWLRQSFFARRQGGSQQATIRFAMCWRRLLRPTVSRFCSP